MRQMLHVCLVLAALLAAQPAFGNVTQCAGSQNVEGIDISVWQGTIDWAKVKADGKAYASIRVGDGYYFDSKFTYNWAQAKKHGVIRSVYQFFEPDLDPITQADILIKHVGGALDPEDLPPMIDVEATGGKSPAVVEANIAKWVARIKEKLGRDAIVYTGKYFWDDHVQSSAQKNLPLWHAQYCGCCPTIAAPWKKWTFWQYTSKGKVSGISGNVDLDKYAGTLAKLQGWIGATTGCDAHCEGTKVVDDACGVTDCAKTSAKCIDDALGVRCVSIYCPATGSSKVCLPSTTNTAMATCTDGKLGKSTNCAKDTLCSAASGGSAKCLSTYCVASPTTKPVAKDLCLPDGGKYTCDAAGDIAPTPCPTGSACKMTAGTATCDAVIVAISATPDALGWWSVRGTGSVEAHGTAKSYGDLTGTSMAKPAVAIVSSPTGLGYWIVTADGDITSFGDAAPLPGLAGKSLPSSIVAAARAGSTQALWLLATDGTVYPIGTAPTLTSVGALAASDVAVGIDATADGQGYWVATAAGAAFARGSAASATAAVPAPLPSPIVSLTRSAGGNGYWLVRADGQLLPAGDAKPGGAPLSVSAPIVGMARHPYGAGYWMVGQDGAVYDFPSACTAQCVGSGLLDSSCAIQSCAAMEANCADDALGARCVSQYCPATGSAEVCLPDPNGFLHGTCTDGVLTEDKCIPGLQWCSTVGAAKGKCVSVYCADYPDSPSVDHNLCMGDGTRWHCDATTGQPTPSPCPNGTQCLSGTDATCVDNPSPDIWEDTTDDVGGGSAGAGYDDADAENGDDTLAEDATATSNDDAWDATGTADDATGVDDARSADVVGSGELPHLDSSFQLDDVGGVEAPASSMPGGCSAMPRREAPTGTLAFLLAIGLLLRRQRAARGVSR